MNTLDAFILIFVVLLAGIGYAQGFIVGAASLFGVALGGVVGTRIARILLERSAAADSTASAWAPVLGLVIGLLIMFVGAMAMQDLGAVIKGHLRARESAAVDHLLGAVLLGMVGLLIAWFSAAAVMGMPQLRDQRSRIVESRIVSTLNAALPPAGPIIGALSSYDPFPSFDGGAITTRPPDGRLPLDPEVRAATRSVLRVSGVACGYRVTGTAWVAAPGYVVTNAHVVAGEERTEVEVRSGGSLDAEVVAFDDVNDLAIMRVDDLGLPPLDMAGEFAPDTAGVIIGYPEQQGLTSTAARYSDQRRVQGEDIRGDGPFPRIVTSFRGLVRHGNSGGPVVDGDGRVMTTVFASTIGAKVRGGYGVPNSIVAEALDQARQVPEGFRVRTGSCIS